MIREECQTLARELANAVVEDPASSTPTHSHKTRKRRKREADWWSGCAQQFATELNQSVEEQVKQHLEPLRKGLLAFLKPRAARSTETSSGQLASPPEGTWPCRSNWANKVRLLPRRMDRTSTAQPHRTGRTSTAKHQPHHPPSLRCSIILPERRDWVPLAMAYHVHHKASRRRLMPCVQRPSFRLSDLCNLPAKQHSPQYGKVAIEN